jgi:hypothetical protein
MEAAPNAWLEQALVGSIEIETVGNSLRATTTPEELVSVWWRDADHTEGVIREALQDIYREHLKKLSGGMTV